MPFVQDTGLRDTENYCSLCHRNGEFHYKGSDVNEFKKMVYGQMLERGISKWKAKFFTFMINFAPHWRRIKRLSQ